jgi:hypothetical protein
MAKGFLEFFSKPLLLAAQLLPSILLDAAKSSDMAKTAYLFQWATAQPS